MPTDLFTAFQDFDDSVSPHVKQYSGLLGLPVTSKTVEVPNRNGYVYVRLRDNTSEIVQAYNEKVSPVYNLPVIIERQGNRWVIVNRDIERYENWGSYSAFLPAHAHQHEFDRDNPGGDTVFSYVDQLMPLNVYPSGTPGSPNVIMGGYSFKKTNGDWAYVGNTGTNSLLVYKPTDNQARMVLVYLDKDTGNPGILVNSGTSFAASLTGTHDVLQYLPANASTLEPAKAVRLVSGTTYIGWENLYDVRQFFGGASSTGTGGGDTTLDANRVVVTNDAGTQTTNSHFTYNYDNNVLIIGTGITTLPGAWSNAFHLVGSGTSPTWTLWAYGANVAGYNTFFRARGDWTTPTAIQHGDVIGRPARFRGHDGIDFSVTQAEIRGQARGNWDAGSHGTDVIMGTTPSGTTTMQDMLTVNQTGTDLLYGKYMISGSPHVHTEIAFNANDLWRNGETCDVSGFTGTIATLPGGTTLTYNTGSGDENTLPVASTSQLAKQLLHNTTRGDNALISQCVVGTNTVTLTANVPAGWQVGDTITTISQTVSGGAGLVWVDFEITSGEFLNKSLALVDLTYYQTTATLNTELVLHPTETYGDGKRIDLYSQVNGVIATRTAVMKINSNLFSLAWTSTQNPAIVVRGLVTL